MNYIRLLWRLNQLKKNLKKSREQMQDLQKDKVYQLLHYAYDHSSYYKEAFTQLGINKENINQTPIAKFPTMDKEILMKHFNEIVTVKDVKQEELRLFDEQEDTKKLFKQAYHVVHSSGSTGKPGYFIYDEDAWNEMLLAIIRGALWDMKMFDIFKLLWKTPRIVYVAATDGRYGGAMAVASGIEGVRAKQLSLDIKQPMHAWIEQIRMFNPNIMIGYTSAIKILAELVERGEVEVHLERVISCGEPLNANLRMYLEHVFQCDVVNFYGASESLALGVELHADEGMYLFDDMNYIEVENGNMYLTSLYNYTQPLIRYKLSDYLVWDREDERYPLSRIKNITGRNEDLMWFEDGNGVREFLHPLAVEGFCIDHMLDYQFIQRDKTSFELDIEVSNERYKEKIEMEMRASLTTILIDKHLAYVQFYIMFVNEILPDQRTGKKQFIVQRSE